MTIRRRQSEGGYALLFVFALSTAMAMMLYLEMPRLALEMQRNREDLLIWRGEQYARAIKVFAKKNRRYPQTIEELENTNGVRFLRRRYLDPMTGKDEWRLIHADASGRLTDSLVQKQNDPTQDPTRQGEKSTNNFVSEGASFGSTSDPNAPNRNPQALNRRASDMPGAPGAMPAPGALTPAPPGTGGGNEGPPPGYQQQQVVPVIGPNGQPIQRIPGLPGQFGQQYPNQAANSQTGGTVPQQSGGVSGGTSFGSGYSGGATPPPSPGNMQQAGMQPMPGGFRPGGGSNSFGPGGAGMPGGMGQPGGGIAVNPATQMIQQILTRPNPQGLQNALGAAAGGAGLGGGIAGVASKYDAEGIKIYKERTNYKEWEFIYDPSKDQKGAGGQQMPGQIPGTNSMQPGTGMGGQTGGFGSQQQGGLGSQGGFGGQQGGFGGQQPGGIRR